MDLPNRTGRKECGKVNSGRLVHHELESMELVLLQELIQVNCLRISCIYPGNLPCNIALSDHIMMKRCNRF